jgi:hypothetical protein
MRRATGKYIRGRKTVGAQVADNTPAPTPAHTQASARAGPQLMLSTHVPYPVASSRAVGSSPATTTPADTLT